MTRENQTMVDVDHPRTLFATIYLSVIGACVFIVQPGFVQGMVQYYGFSEQQAGFIASAEIWGLAMSTVILAFTHHLIRWRRVLYISLLVFAVGNLASLLTTDPVTFAALRFCNGVGAGGLVSLTFTIIGLTRLPDRNFGFLIMGVLTYGALGLWVMPLAMAHVGLQGVIVFFAIFALSGLPLVRMTLDSGQERPQVEADAIDMNLVFRCAAIAAMFLYFFAQGVIWAYLFLIGLNAGVTEQAVANGLMVSQFLGILGAFVPAMLHNRLGRLLPLSLGILGGSMVLTMLYGAFSAAVYTLTVCIYNFAWNMTHPFLLGAMASFDRHGRVVVYAVAAQMLGLAMGPALGATLLQDDNYAPIITAGITLFALSWICIAVPVLKHRQLLKAPGDAVPGTG